MKKIALATAIIASSLASANDLPELKFQAGNPVSPWSGSAYFDFRTNTTNAVVLNKFRDLTINGKPTRFSFYGFAGTTVDGEGKAVGGLALGREFAWFDQFSFFAGVGVSFSGGNPVGGGVLVGAMIRF